MSGTFSGFSEDYIKKIKFGDSPEIEKPKLVFMKKKAHRNLSPKIENTAEILSIPENARLSKKCDTLESNKTTETKTNQIENVTDQKNVSQNLELSDKTENKHFEIRELSKQKISLDEFQAQQKIIEERNKRTKELLAKALADRTKKTKAEAQRLEIIQKELQKLDNLLSNDVAILRNQIELASFDFMEAQKRYNKVEQEFLNAKVSLQQKQEKKELLTEHLCTIIQQNEQRKAEKLAELMNKLEVNIEEFAQRQALENESNKTVQNITSDTEK